MESLLPKEIEDEIRRHPVVYVPWGAMEWHGEHLPLGQDALKAFAICCRAAERTGGIVFPPLYIGHQTLRIYGFPYTLEFSSELVKRLAFELLNQLEDMGFKVIVILCGHYGKEHLKVIERAVEEYKAKGGKAKVLAVPEYAFAEDKGYRGDHAAKWETSIFWYFYPNMVHLERIEKEEKPKGIYGEDPRKYASRELGESIVNVIVDRLVDKVKKLLKEVKEGE
ncbi:MAG: hypothetical protein DRJ66_01260 [Thermoprotei archaeon]|nr:MAG: hypothetical protein DRJ66_01260 [Thermoprotei archaeon]